MPFVPFGKARAQKKRVARMPLCVVIAGLDPAIHAEVPLLRFAVVVCFRLVSMDHRIKPGGDEDGGRSSSAPRRSHALYSEPL